VATKKQANPLSITQILEIAKNEMPGHSPIKITAFPEISANHGSIASVWMSNGDYAGIVGVCQLTGAIAWVSSSVKVIWRREEPWG
jgi:hypothetical protein